MSTAMQTTKQVGEAPTGDIPMLCLAPRGLAIFPVRYAVVPDSPAFANIKLPGGMGNKTDVPLKHHKYALRTLREGFIYVYYHKHPDGKKWDIFIVNEDAKFSELSVKHFKKGEEKITLAGLNHFFIDKPDQQDKVDFAFSEHPWSKETLESMESDSSLRNRRMQTFRPKEWVSSPHFPHGLPLTEQNLEQVFEYSDEFEAFDVFHPDSVACRNISNGQGEPQLDTLTLNTSSNEFRMLQDELSDTVKCINLNPKSTRNQPMLLALWDAVGITRELGGFAMDAAGWANQYLEQHELELDALNHIELIQNSLEEAGKAFNKERENLDRDYLEGKIGAAHQEHIEQQNQRQIDQLNYKLKTQYADVPASELKNIPAARKILNELIRLQDIKALKNKPMEERLAHRQQKRIADNWSKYQTHINNNKVTFIKQSIAKIETQTTQLITQRIEDQIKWLESTYLFDALVEFSEQQVSDGRFFNDLIGDLLLGLGSCEPGHNKLTQYVADCKVTEDNLFWRSVAANQQKEKTLLNTVLAEANARENETVDEATVMDIKKDYFDRMLDIVKINNDSHGLATEVMGKTVPTGGLEKIYASVGFRLFNPLIKVGVDTPKMIIVKTVYEASLGYREKLTADKYTAMQDNINHTYNTRMNDHSQQQWDKEERVMDIEEEIAKKKRQINKPTGKSWNQNKKPWGQDGYDKWYRQHGHKLDAERAELGLAIERHKQEIERLGEFRKGKLAKVQYSYEQSVKSLNRGIDKKIEQYEKWNASDKGISFGFGIIILAFQAASLKQVITALGENPEDKELRLKLLIASTGIAATGAGLAASLINNEKSILLKGLKVGGSSLMIVNGVLSGLSDIGEVGKNNNASKRGIMSAYFIKAVLNFVGSGLSAALLAATVKKSWETALSIQARAIALRMGKIGIDAAGRFVLARFIGILNLWVGLGIFALEIIIMLMYEDELEKWIRQTKFAKKPESKLFNDIAEQQEAFHQAIADVFGKDEKESQAAQKRRTRIPRSNAAR